MATELDIDDVCADHPKAMAELKILRDGIKEIRRLIDSSDGVAGLVNDGLIHSWEDLESWDALIDFLKAEKVTI